jgi:hypothetical protein
MKPYGIFADAVLDDLYRQLVAIQTKRADALAAMRKANRAGDDNAWDAATEAHDACSGELGEIRPLIDELEDDGEPKGFAAMYHAIKI